MKKKKIKQQEKEKETNNNINNDWELKMKVKREVKLMKKENAQYNINIYKLYIHLRSYFNWFALFFSLQFDFK